jgi:hypothetical protein
MRLFSGRHTRLSDTYSPKVENHMHAVGLQFFAHKFCRAPRTLTKKAGGVQSSPSVAQDRTAHVWKLEELAAVLHPTQPIA